MVPVDIKNTFRSERLQFVRLDKNDDDVKAFFKRSLNNPETYALAMTMLMRPQGPQQVEHVIEGYSKALLPVMICLPSMMPAGKPVIIGELVIGDGDFHISTAQNRNVGLGLSLLPEYQDKGYGREAIDWALDWCFRHANMHTVSIGTVSFNTRAEHLYKKMGFVPEGRKRQVIWYDRQWYDSLLFSMIEEEWEALRGIKKE